VNCDGARSSISVTTGRADLGNINVTHSLSSGFDPTTGNYNNVRLNFNTENIGISSTIVNPSYRMEYLGSQTSPASIGILDAGDTSANLSQSFSDVPFGNFEVTVRVDTADQVDESNESNNEERYQVSLDAPDPELSLVVDPEILRTGESTTLSWDTSATYPLECTVEGPGMSFTDNVAPYSGSQTVGPITAKMSSHSLVKSQLLTPNGLKVWM
jgi:hypothetical protein